MAGHIGRIAVRAALIAFARVLNHDNSVGASDASAIEVVECLLSEDHRNCVINDSVGIGHGQIAALTGPQVVESAAHGRLVSAAAGREDRALEAVDGLHVREGEVVEVISGLVGIRVTVLLLVVGEGLPVESAAVGVAKLGRQLSRVIQVSKDHGWVCLILEEELAEDAFPRVALALEASLIDLLADLQ